ncbi:MAG: pseudouridine synthase [Opitutaceae bacterium]|nr:pseudouridine synthase [Cytophagales bacterium]
MSIEPDKIYVAYYKPVGVESTLNKNIANNLADAIPIPERLFPLGRLDKASEGLMILTNDGKIYNGVTNSKNQKEKEYEVKVDQLITEDFLQKMSSGIEIMGQVTKPCEIRKVDEFTFNIILTQGLNRQIRRMCYKLSYEVTNLKRIRIMNVLLGNLKIGGFRFFTEEEIEGLIKAI